MKKITPLEQFIWTLHLMAAGYTVDEAKEIVKDATEQYYKDNIVESEK